MVGGVSLVAKERFEQFKKEGRESVRGGEGAFQAHYGPFWAQRTPRAKALGKEPAVFLFKELKEARWMMERTALILSETDRCRVLNRSDWHFKRNILTALLGRKG